jgi:hypothetical protein
MAGTNKGSGSSAIRDNTTGLTAEVGTKTGGEDAVHVISEIDSFPPGGVLTKPFEYAVALGQVPGYARIAVFGHNTSIGSIEETIWTEGGIYMFPTSAAILDISSSSANDNSAGTGGRTMLIEGLDSNYDEISEVVTLNGVATGNTVNSYLRVNKAKFITVGSSTYNEGKITIENTGVVVCIIDISHSTSYQGVYTVPNNKTALVLKGIMTYDKNNAGEVKLTGIINGVSTQIILFEVINGEVVYDSVFPFPVPEKSDLVLNGSLQTGNGNITGGFEILLVDD